MWQVGQPHKSQDVITKERNVQRYKEGKITGINEHIGQCTWLWTFSCLQKEEIPPCSSSEENFIRNILHRCYFRKPGHRVMARDKKCLAGRWIVDTVSPIKVITFRCWHGTTGNSQEAQQKFPFTHVTCNGDGSISSATVWQVSEGCVTSEWGDMEKSPSCRKASKQSHK